jgi:hypothetical protein
MFVGGLLGEGREKGGDFWKITFIASLNLV